MARLVTGYVENYYPVGKIVGVRGIKGEMVIQHTMGEDPMLDGWEVVFIEEHKQSFIPHFILSAQLVQPDELWLQLDDIHTREQALLLVHKQVYLPEEEFRTRAPHSPLQLLGYEIRIDDPSQPERLGLVEEIIETPTQLIVKTHYQQKEILIPLHAQTWVATDARKKHLYLRLPDGLLDVYL
ncbi:MAG: 16S rRNA processing protein RimM [Thermoflavifilum sp.]|uniref:ribosome maturation factor RimM n=1 Tax=Thermoflavifilum sp. TaxID=1968839 RepID=UPI0018A4D06D|nr:16S rRNA processing protein RimM [Thermoflavifilum sp.]QOR76419.1 MAG: 16S rRNA processing protein RimM [Thermoflavifilum sp.]